MRVRSLSLFIGLLAALALTLSSVVPALAQDGSPEPALSPAIIEKLDERRAERDALREERRVTRATKREERAAAREIAKAERAQERDRRKAERALKHDQRVALREEKKAARTKKKAAWGEAREACRTELAAIRAQDWDDRDARKSAWGEARAACRDAFITASSSATKDAPVDQLYSDVAGADASGVVRTDLGIAEPESAWGQELGLWHYLIPAGQELAVHTHPGWQLARVTAGELEYTVTEGEGVLLRTDGSSEPMGPGTYVLATGDGVIENPELVHFGANRGSVPVTIISATLFAAGEPIASVIEARE